MGLILQVCFDLVGCEVESWVFGFDFGKWVVDMVWIDCQEYVGIGFVVVDFDVFQCDVIGVWFQFEIVVDMYWC